jgi:hypothetical protein
VRRYSLTLTQKKKFSAVLLAKDKNKVLSVGSIVLVLFSRLNSSSDSVVNGSDIAFFANFFLSFTIVFMSATDINHFMIQRVPELTDASAFEAAQLKRLSEKVEEELWKYYGGVNSLYQRKYRALVSHLTDGNNQVDLLNLNTNQNQGLPCFKNGNNNQVGMLLSNINQGGVQSF